MSEVKESLEPKDSPIQVAVIPVTPFQQNCSLIIARPRSAWRSSIQAVISVTVGALTLDVHHCPGHTPRHVVFFHADADVWR